MGSPNDSSAASIDDAETVGVDLLVTEQHWLAFQETEFEKESEERPSRLRASVEEASNASLDTTFRAMRYLPITDGDNGLGVLGANTLVSHRSS